MKGKTSTGFEFDIEDERLDDMELVDIMAEIDENRCLCQSFARCSWERAEKRLYDHLRSEDGRVPIEATTNAIQEIFNSPGDLKNS